MRETKTEAIMFTQLINIYKWNIYIFLSTTQHVTVQNIRLTTELEPELMKNMSKRSQAKAKRIVKGNPIKNNVTISGTKNKGNRAVYSLFVSP